MEKKQSQTGNVTKVREKSHEPKHYLVIFHNDNVTTMDFVVMVLMRIFRKSETDARRIMLEVHVKGKGVAGRYTYDIAKTKSNQTIRLARSNGVPLRVTVEPEI